ncbi:uncharacterized protein N7529_001058 [Penicillium soppii]|uniref:uncharacterized protein n=1 Tax=Penicillium soppii TaxID=69789 RepID=UPI002547ABE6|nr:uncharacterized protein N7529_001058 [Penicillium soppii]KAJ5882386.1 hypothetical protein N7529_001058 [Penicillium soppii]
MATLFGPSISDTEEWTLPVWGVIFDRLASGNVKGSGLTIGGGSSISEKTPAQQIQWATKLPLDKLEQFTIDAILNRFVGFSLGVRYMEEDKIHTLHQLVQPGCPLRSKVNTWLRWVETEDLMKSMIRSYDSYELAQADIEQVTKWPREADNHPFKTNPAYDAAVKCSHCLQFLVEQGFVKLSGYDLSGRNWLKAALNGSNVELLDYLAEHMDPEDLLKPRDIRDPVNAGNHILLTLAGYGAFKGFEIALNRMIQEGVLRTEQLSEIFHPAAVHELCTVVPPSVASALYAKGINIGNIEHQHHPLGGQLDGSWHMAAAFNPFAGEFMDWLHKHSLLTPENRNQDNETPLMYAANFNEISAITWLCKHTDPALPRFDGGAPGYALLCAARSSYPNSPQIFCLILDAMPKAVFTVDYGKICGTEIAEGLVRHKTKLAKGQIQEPSLVDIERAQVWKMQALVCRLPGFWPGSSWHLGLEAYATNNGVAVLRHSMGTETRRTRSTSARRRQAEAEHEEALAEMALFAVAPEPRIHRSNAVRGRGTATSGRPRSGQRDSALGRTRNSSNMVTKNVRRRQMGTQRS